MSKLLVPQQLTPHVIDFCASISKAEPYYVDVVPAPEARLFFCTENVENKIKEHGGAAIYGYQIWERTGLFIEAEFHAIWQSLKGERIDITPKQNKTDKILFLHHPELRYEGKQINNIRRSLQRNEIINKFFAIFDAVFAIQNYGSRAYQLKFTATEEEAEILRWLEEWKGRLQIMMDRGLTRNNLCQCKSGGKFKHCCLKELEHGLSILKKKYEF